MAFNYSSCTHIFAAIGLKMRQTIRKRGRETEWGREMEMAGSKAMPLPLESNSGK